MARSSDAFGVEILAGLADLLLVDGDPLVRIGGTLSIRSVWHRGAVLAGPTPARCW